MQVFLIILCRKIMFWLLSSPFPTLFLSFSYLQYNNKPKSQENASILSKNLLKMLTKGGKKLATNSHIIFSTLHFSPLFPTTQNFAPYLILLFIFITSIGASLFHYCTKQLLLWYNQKLRNFWSFANFQRKLAYSKVAVL